MLLTLILWAAAGVVVSVLLPILATYVRQHFPRPEANGIPLWLRPYLVLGVFSLIVAVLCVMWWMDQHPDKVLTEQKAFLIGFAWETVLEKVSLPPSGASISPHNAREGIGLLILLALMIAGAWALFVG
jgi:uncharacterized membrane protein SpoIIM required for sporulation